MREPCARCRQRRDGRAVRRDRGAEGSSSDGGTPPSPAAAAFAVRPARARSGRGDDRRVGSRPAPDDETALEAAVQPADRADRPTAVCIGDEIGGAAVRAAEEPAAESGTTQAALCLGATAQHRGGGCPCGHVKFLSGGRPASRLEASACHRPAARPSHGSGHSCVSIRVRREHIEMSVLDRARVGDGPMIAHGSNTRSGRWSHQPRHSSCTLIG